MQRINSMSNHSNSGWRSHLHWRQILLACCLLSLSIWTPGAQAQLGLPSLPLPNTSAQLPTLPVNSPVTNLTRQLDNIVIDATSELDSQSQRLLRLARVRALLRANPDTLEVDAHGAPVLRSQVVSLSPTPQSLQAASAAGFAVIQDQALDELGIRMVTLQAPTGMSAQRALQKLRKLDRLGSYDYNHVYTQSAASVQASATPANTVAVAMYPDTRVGLIDGGVDVAHPVFHGNRLHTWGCNQQVIASAHGTAVASLLVGHGERFNGAAPGAQLYAADVYCGEPVGGAMTRIAGAMAWLAQQQVPVINVSLVGPDNALLKQLVANLIARGHLLVAAVGNDGPAAPPLYPASYPNVIGVTAVDTHDRALVEAGRGKQVMLAAPGADMAAATLNGAFATVRGTSFAAPLVAGLLAIHIDKPQADAAHAALSTVLNSARDLGSKGLDKSYGYGVVGESLRMAISRASGN